MNDFGCKLIIHFNPDEIIPENHQVDHEEVKHLQIQFEGCKDNHPDSRIFQSN